MYSRLWHAVELGEVYPMYIFMCIYIYMCIYMCVHVCIYVYIYVYINEYVFFQHVCMLLVLQTLASGTPLSWARYVVCVSIYICVYLGVYMYALSPLARR